MKAVPPDDGLVAFQCPHCAASIDDEDYFMDPYNPNTHSGDSTAECPACHETMRVKWYSTVVYKASIP